MKLNPVNINNLKQLVFLFIVLSFSLGCYAQEHIKFMGLPVTGNVSQFVSKLKTKGFVTKNVSADKAFKQLKGNFASEECTLNIYFNKRTKETYKVLVGIVSDKYSVEAMNEDIIHRFNRIKNDLITKYNDATIKKNSNEELELEIVGGRIELSKIEADIYNRKALVVLSYVDNTGIINLTKTIINDLTFENEKFLGIPLQSSLSAFTSGLQRKGFTLSKTKAVSGERSFFGVYADEDVMLNLYYEKKTSKVTSINVFFLNEKDDHKLHEKYLEKFATLYPEAGYIEGDDRHTLIIGATTLSMTYVTGLFVFTIFPTSVLEDGVEKLQKKSYDDL